MASFQTVYVFIYYYGTSQNPLFGSGRLNWRGTLVGGRFFLHGDPLLQRLLPPNDRYMVYRARQHPHWRFSSRRQGEHVEDNEFLIYRPWGYFDDDFDGIEDLIPRLHRRLGLNSNTIPPRYQPLAIEHQRRPRQIRESSQDDSDSSDYTESEDNTDDDIYLIADLRESGSDDNGDDTGYLTPSDSDVWLSD